MYSVVQRNIVSAIDKVNPSAEICFCCKSFELSVMAFCLCRPVDRETRVDADAMTPDVTGALQQAKVPLHPKDIVNSKKVIAVRKEKTRKLGRQRSFGTSLDYSPIDIDKHEPEFVSSVVENPSVCVDVHQLICLEGHDLSF